MLLSMVENRRAGVCRPQKLRNISRTSIGQNLSVNEGISFSTEHCNYVACLDIENVECRYLLSGCNNGCVAIYDTANIAQTGPLEPIAKSESASSSRSNRSSGSSATVISSVQWYPFDTGMFFSGSLEGKMKVWDTNLFQPVHAKRAGKRVNDVQTSSISTHHSLLAVATEQHFVSLFDLRSGLAINRTLEGHTGPVLSLSWSPRDEFLICSGSSDGAVKMWDVRRSGDSACVATYDRLNTKGTVLRNGKAAAWKRSCNSHVAASTAPVLYRKRKQREEGRVAYVRDEVTSVKFSPDGLYVVSVSAGRMTLWKSDGTNMLVDFPHFSSTYKSRPSPMSFLPFGALKDTAIAVPAGHNSADIHVYDLFTGCRRASLTGHFDRLTSLIVQDYGSSCRIYSASQDSNIHVWGHHRTVS